MLWLPLYLIWIASEVLIAIITRTKQGGGDVRDRGTMLLLWIVIVFSMTLSGYARYYFETWYPFSPLVRHLGTAVLLAGLVIRLFSVLWLGKAFSANVAIRESQKLNQSGAYKFIRHPSYLGLVIIFFAIGLHSGNPVGLACACVPTTAMLLYRIHVEEAALVSAFGAEYEGYMGRTKRLIPWVY